MLKLTILGNEHFDEKSSEFSYPDAVTIELEHSLVSLSKWEQKFEKPFLTTQEKTVEETLYYIHAMNLGSEIAPEVLNKLSLKNVEEINRYLDAKMTATWFTDISAPKSYEVVTSELIYYWLVSYKIPFEVQYWHLNTLFTLIRVCNLKNAKPKQMSRSEIAQRNRALNAQRKEKFKTNG